MERLVLYHASLYGSFNPEPLATVSTILPPSPLAPG
jgi:hypothetical protein